MAIEKQINPNSLNIEKNNTEVEVEVLNPEAVSISTEEEGMIIDFGQGEEVGEEIRDHNVINGEAIGVEIKEIEDESKSEYSQLEQHTKK